MFRSLQNLFGLPEIEEDCDQEDTTFKFDPFQIFEVAPEPCQIVRVTVLRGISITKGGWSDFLDTPDPYVKLKILYTPNNSKKTKYVDNDANPTWNETFNFYVDPQETNVLQVTLMDANYTVDEELGSREVDLSAFPTNTEVEHTVTFPMGSKVVLKLFMGVDPSPDLRYSLTLCDDEKDFLLNRKRHAFKALIKLLGLRGPQTLREVPTIGLLGSGGGFRAMVSLSGVFKALSQSGLLDAITYVAGLSGSAWYISQLYSHPDFPGGDMEKLRQHLRDNIDESPFWLLSPQSLTRYIGSVLSKRWSGQHVSFTDFFGHLLGETLLPQRKDSKLSDQRGKIDRGQSPLPLYTCLHVKKNVMAKVYQEWLEFSPYEVGIAKYGTFMKSDDFGSKFYVGRIVRRYPEYPLHFLQGVWGSAFCILFKQLYRENGRKDVAEILRENDPHHNEEELNDQLANFKIDDKDSETEDESDDEVRMRRENKRQGSKKSRTETPKKMSMDKSAPETLDNMNPQHKTLWHSIVESVFTSSYMDTLKGRAAAAFNPFRGLRLNYLAPVSPFSPTTPNDDLDFKGTYESLSTDKRNLYLVDGGLTFNSPYPLLLRPQRGIDLYISFDFSGRPTDDTPPFKEILVAEKWARMNNIPFPPIEQQAREFSKGPVRECYVFRDPSDPRCPIIAHFVMVNNQFKKFKAPGVPRTTEEEKEFADFPIFDDPTQQYSLYNFSYSHLQFDRISKLMEFNTLLNVDVIKNLIAELVVEKRNRVPLNFSDIAKMKVRLRTKDAVSQLRRLVRTLSLKDGRQQQSPGFNAVAMVPEIGNHSNGQDDDQEVYYSIG